MSAFLCNDYHIAYLVQAGIVFGLVDPLEAHAVGECLFRTNLVSLAHRYPKDGDLSSVARTWRSEGESYLAPIVSEPVDLWFVLKGAQCYEYQACEFAEWLQSDACAFVDALCEEALSRLPERFREEVPLRWGSEGQTQPRAYQCGAYEDAQAWEIRPPQDRKPAKDATPTLVDVKPQKQTETPTIAASKSSVRDRLKKGRK